MPLAPITRRHLLKTAALSSTVLSIGGRWSGFPTCLLHASEQTQSTSTNDNILVVIQLSGGNDGLNTVVPFHQQRYYDARPTLAIPKSQVLKINDQLGFHPAMTEVAELMEAGSLSVIQGVGYPHPNRSHFESMDIWHTCRRKTERREQGWLGDSVLAAEPAKNSTPILHLGSEKQPRALASTLPRAISIRSLDQFKLKGNQPAITQVVADAKKNSADNGLLDFVQSSTSAALRTSAELLQSASQNVKQNDAATYPENALAQKLKTTAQLIDSPLKARVYYVTLDGFDTHAQQAGAHQVLTEQWSGALGAFVQDLVQRGHDQHVSVMVFSEFGRRIEENASKGTDHGTAAPMFLAGSAVQSGMIGEHPSLLDIEQGDLKFQIDFRQVYRSVLNWMGWDSKTALAGDYDPLPLF